MRDSEHRKLVFMGCDEERRIGMVGDIDRVCVYQKYLDRLYIAFFHVHIIFEPEQIEMLTIIIRMSILAFMKLKRASCETERTDTTRTQDRKYTSKDNNI